MIPNSSLIVSPTEPTRKNRKKVWMQNTDTDKKIYIKNSNDVYEEFIKKYEEKYSTSETKIGTWIDGKTLYRKTISCGALPNQSTVTINHNINNLDKIINVRGYATNSNKTSFLPLPYPNANSICLFCESNIIGIITYSDRTSYTECYITLEYTKNN